MTNLNQLLRTQCVHLRPTDRKTAPAKTRGNARRRWDQRTIDSFLSTSPVMGKYKFNGVFFSAGYKMTKKFKILHVTKGWRIRIA